VKLYNYLSALVLLSSTKQRNIQTAKLGILINTQIQARSYHLLLTLQREN